MSDLSSIAVGGVGGVDDLATNAALAAAVIALSTTLSAASFPAPTAVTVVEAVALGLDVANLRSPAPFQEAAEKWGEVARALHTFRDETEAKVRACGEDAWDGPGAEAFRNYVDGKLLPKVEKLAEAAEHIEEGCETTTKTLVLFGIVPYFASTAAALFMTIGLQVLRLVPEVGEALFEIIEMAVHLTWAGVQLATIVGLQSAELGLRAVEFTKSLQEIGELKELLAGEGNRLDADSLVPGGK